MKVMKFGGTSVKGAARIRETCSLIISTPERPALVFSAMKGTTDLLIKAAERASVCDPEFESIVLSIEKTHLEAAAELVQGNYRQECADALAEMCGQLQSILKGVSLVRECSPRSLDLIMGFGERLNCRLITYHFLDRGVEATYLDARLFIFTTDEHGQGRVLFDLTNRAVKKAIDACKGLPVITGFVGSTVEGISTTLGRNGSDYTAAIIGGALKSEVIEIWTDVDGVLSADPRIIPQAFVVDEITIEEAMEMSYFGAQVIHPYTVIPAVQNDIPIVIKNTMNPAAPGTRIVKNAKPHGHPITGIASIGKAALLNVEGNGFIQSKDLTSRLFSLLAEHSIPIIMISQASSEHSLCLALLEDHAEKACALFNEKFKEELACNEIQNIALRKDIEVIAVIGENMKGRPGIAGKLFACLGNAGINVLAIAQGSSERNISCIIERKDTLNALKEIHKTFLGV